MKSTSLSAAAIVLLMPVVAFAAQKNSETVVLDRAVTVEDTQIPAGQYKVSWEGNGPDVTVSFAEDNKTVVTALAKLSNNTTNEQSVETDTAGGGTPVLDAIALRRVTLQFENAIPSEGD
jgi:hypothetical protein